MAERDLEHERYQVGLEWGRESRAGHTGRQCCQSIAPHRVNRHTGGPLATMKDRGSVGSTRIKACFSVSMKPTKPQKNQQMNIRSSSSLVSSAQLSRTQSSLTILGC